MLLVMWLVSINETASSLRALGARNWNEEFQSTYDWPQDSRAQRLRREAAKLRELQQQRALLEPRPGGVCGFNWVGGGGVSCAYEVQSVCWGGAGPSHSL